MLTQQFCPPSPPPPPLAKKSGLQGARDIARAYGRTAQQVAGSPHGSVLLNHGGGGAVPGEHLERPQPRGGGASASSSRYSEYRQ